MKTIEALGTIKKPTIEVVWEDGERSFINMKDFLSNIIKDPESEYWDILKDGAFEKVYIKNGGLKWGNILSAMNCGGDEGKVGVHFNAGEFLLFLEKAQLS